MLQNAYFLAKIGADTAENEQHFAEILPIGRRSTCTTRSSKVLRELPEAGGYRDRRSAQYETIKTYLVP